MSSTNNQQDLANLRPAPDDDTIDLGELLRGLIAQWKIIIAITLVGAVASVVVALLQPKQYRVEAIISQPSRSDVRPLLAQQISPITLDELTQAFLLNVQSQNLIERAYNNTDMGVGEDGSELTPEEQFSAVRNVSDALSVGPVRYEFYELTNGENPPLNNISVNLLTSNPGQAKAFIDELLALAEETTVSQTISDINANKSIRIETAQTTYDQLVMGAEASLERERQRVSQALAVARALGIEEPTSWEALVHGAGNIQMITQEENEDDLFLHGSRFLEARLESLNGEGARELFLEGTEEREISLTGTTQVRTISPSQLQGEIRALRSQTFSIDDIDLLEGDTWARIPSNAEKPNRPLIAVAGTVLAGFLGLFIALIRLAIRRKD